MRSLSEEKCKKYNKPNNKRSQIQKNDDEPDYIYKQYGDNTKTKLHVTTNEDVRKEDKRDTSANDISSKTEV